MRFLSVNHLRLGSSPGGIPAHLAADSRAFSTRLAWSRAVTTAIRNHVHAVLLSGHTLSPTNSSLEPWGPLVEGLADLAKANIPVIAVAEGEFNPENLARFATRDAVHWLNDTLDWNPLITIRIDAIDVPAVHVVSAALAEQEDAPVANTITIGQIDQPESIWILTDSNQPDNVSGEHALIIEPGSVTPLRSSETGRHGAWLIDTESRSAELVPLANLEFAAIAIDISDADSLDELERIVSTALVNEATAAHQDDSVATIMLVDVTITGSSRLYGVLADTLHELHQMLVIEHADVTIAISHVAIDATPEIDLAPLLNRPDPVGEVARLINALSSGEDLTDSQARLLTAAEQKMLAVCHARVFGSILDDTPEIDAPTLLLRQGWATLDALVRQRGVD